MRTNVVLAHTGALNSGQRYELAENIEAALVRDGAAVSVKAAPKNKAQSAPNQK